MQSLKYYLPNFVSIKICTIKLKLAESFYFVCVCRWLRYIYKEVKQPNVVSFPMPSFEGLSESPMLGESRCLHVQHQTPARDNFSELCHREILQWGSNRRVCSKPPLRNTILQLTPEKVCSKVLKEKYNQWYCNFVQQLLYLWPQQNCSEFWIQSIV